MLHCPSVPISKWSSGWLLRAYYERNGSIDFISYFEVNYIGAQRGSRPNRHRTEPPFPIKHWNLFDRANNDQQRTNNSVEAFHNMLRTVTNSHPTIWRLIECLRREEGLASKRLVDLRMRNSDRKKEVQSYQRKAGQDSQTLRSEPEKNVPGKYISVLTFVLARWYLNHGVVCRYIVLHKSGWIACYHVRGNNGKRFEFLF